ncbi:hypothetical protein CEXT_610501 [Caerostris extrusa]|uniref:Uncharacterized protein n=1 Tax=Caerostris extrusa TaxID=172846 RepID=A0AAV4P789_CAEEX|nr:hypothetical protein CEXT_610501 [Caerostris extrusa]
MKTFSSPWKKNQRIVSCCHYLVTTDGRCAVTKNNECVAFSDLLLSGFSIIEVHVMSGCIAAFRGCLSKKNSDDR